MQVVGFSHYNLRALREQLEALRSFYLDVVGLRQGERPPFARFGYWLYAGQTAVLHLTEASPDEARAAGTLTTFDHAAFDCVGRGAFERKLAQVGVRYEIAHVPQTDQVQLLLRDPAGNGVELNFSGVEA